MALTTTDTLVTDALWRAGEPTGGTSDFQTQVLQYLNDIQNVLLTGGTLGARDLATSAGLYAGVVEIPVIDWPFFLKQPRGVFNTVAAIQNQGTVTVTQNSATLSFSVAPTGLAAGWRLQLQQAAVGVPGIPTTVPRIASYAGGGATTATLDAPWPQQTQTVSTWQVFQLEYALAADFVRLAAAPVVHATGNGQSPAILDMSVGQAPMEDVWPLTLIQQGVPDAGALIAPQTIQLNRWDTQMYRVEYAYIAQPAALITGGGQIPVIPTRYLAVLSIGAAMLVAQDKADVKAHVLSSEFRELIQRMSQEFRKQLAVASETYGRFLFRGRGRLNDGRIVRTSSGQIIY